MAVENIYGYGKWRCIWWHKQLLTVSRFTNILSKKLATKIGKTNFCKSFKKATFMPHFLPFDPNWDRKKKLVRSETWGLLLNTLTSNCVYLRHGRENLPLPVQMKLSKKTFSKKTFCGYFVSFLQFKLNCNILNGKWSL